MAAGTHRADRHGDPAQEPRGDLLLSVPDPPELLGEIGAAKWQEVCLRLIGANLLQSLDLDSLACYCRDWEIVIECDRQLADDGLTYDSDGELKKQHPAVAIRDRAMSRLASYQREFCMTPSARAGKSVGSSPASTVATRPRRGSS